MRLRDAFRGVGHLHHWHTPVMRMRPIVPAGMVFAVAPTAAVIMGDSLMYVVLPVAAVEFGAGDQFGLAASFWIGLALSINRFIRLISNAFAASVYQRFGVRWPFVCFHCHRLPHHTCVRSGKRSRVAATGPRRLGGGVLAHATRGAADGVWSRYIGNAAAG